MLEFNKIYLPITSRPFLSSQTYCEYQPHELLRPYISCYWVQEGTECRKKSEDVLVIPDACMDILIRVNHTKEVISGYLCGIQDEPFFSMAKENGDDITCFAIRFHFWSAHLFINLKFDHTKNQNIELAVLGKEWEALFDPFFYLRTPKERIAWTESYLLKKLETIEWNSVLFNSINQILSNPGRKSIKDICAYSCVSQRQTERLFLNEIGLPLKRISNLVRYQNVWRDMILSPCFDIQEAVYRYGYTDQAHLLKEFKRFHGITPKEAKEIAYRNQ